MKIKLSFIILSLSLILFGCEIRRATVYVEHRPAVIVAEPVTEVVIIEGRPVHRFIVAPRPIIRHEIRRHH